MYTYSILILIHENRSKGQITLIVLRVYTLINQCMDSALSVYQCKKSSGLLSQNAQTNRTCRLINPVHQTAATAKNNGWPSQLAKEITACSTTSLMASKRLGPEMSRNFSSAESTRSVPWLLFFLCCHDNFFITGWGRKTQRERYGELYWGDRETNGKNLV